MVQGGLSQHSSDQFNDLGFRLVTLEVETCPADLDGDGTVAVSDLLSLLSAWGPCDGCSEDLDDNGAVDTADLLTLLADWGPCE